MKYQTKQNPSHTRAAQGAKFIGLTLLLTAALIAVSLYTTTTTSAQTHFAAESKQTILNFAHKAFTNVARAFQSSTEQEPNDSPEQANAIAIPAQISGNVKVGDAAQFTYQYSNGPQDKIEDFFKFTVPAGETRRLDISLTFANADADVDLLLFKKVNNNVQAIAVSNGSTTTERITPIITLDAGEYFIGVSAFDGSTAVATSYTLNVRSDLQPPAPTIASVVPQSAVAGGGPFSITVNGANFISNQSVVRWNGVAKTTTFVSTGQLVAFLTPADIAAAGTASITVANPPSLGGPSNAISFVIAAPGSPEAEVEPNETSQQATLLLAPGRRAGSVAVGDLAQFTILPNQGPSDPVEDFFSIALTQPSRLELRLSGGNTSANLALYLLKEINGDFTVLGSSRLPGAAQNITTPTILPAGRYLVGVSAVTGSSSYLLEAAVPGNRLLQVNGSSAAPNSTVTVPLSFLAEGNENTIRFSLGFNPAAINNPQVTLGADAAAGTLNINASQVAQGRIGIELTLPAGQKLAAGAREIVKLNFAVANQANGSTPIQFVDSPTVPGIVDASGNALIGTYAAGLVVVVSGFEGDVSPRPFGNGDGAVTIADWTQVGRFVAGIDTPADGSELQRADVAPQNTRGDGRLSIADWVLAGRYASGLDAVVAAGGPTTFAAAAIAAEGVALTFEKPGFEQNLTSGTLLAEYTLQQGRTLRVIPATFVRGQENTAVVELGSLGDENAVGFSINFDTTQLTFVRAVLGSSATGAILNVNTAQTAQGRVGIGLALPSGQTFPAGARQIVSLVFNVPASSSVNATTLSFGDQPIPREVVGPAANLLAATYTAGFVTLTPTVNNTPTLGSLNPVTVNVGGNNFTLTVTGTNFVEGSIVRVNGVDRATQFVSATQLRATILAQDITDTGTLNISVRNPDTGSSNTLSLTVVNPAPTVTSLSPTGVAVGGPGFSLTVNGTGFVPGAQVQWNGATRITSFISSTQLIAQIPSSDIRTAGTASVRVVNPEPGGGTSNALSFNISSPSPVPRLTQLSPNTVQAGSDGFPLTVTGTNFTANSVVRLNGNPLPTTFVSATQLTAQVAASDIATAGNASITVFTPAPGGGASNALILSITVPPNPAPQLTAISPTTVTSGGPGFNLTVTGTGFVQTSVVRVNGQNRATLYVSPTELRAAILASDIANGGSLTISVFNPAPGGGTSGNATLTVNFGAPTITQISPSSAVAGGPAFTLNVIGTNFAPGSVVRFNGQDRPTQVGGPTELTAQITAADIANIGTAQITVFSPPPVGGGLSNAVTFTINQAARPVPRVTSITPNTAQAGSGAFTLTVTGLNFVTDSVVKWNGAVRPTTFVNSTTLTAQIPAEDVATAGTARVSVFTPPAGGGDSNDVTFTITAPPNPAPTITSFNPAVATIGGPNFTLTINGTGFVPGSLVQINGINRQTTFVSATQLTVQILAEEIQGFGSIGVRVLNPPPGGGTSAEVQLPIANPVPAITSINPAVVAEGSGNQTLTINGTGFVRNSQVLVNGVVRVTNYVSPTQLTVQILGAEVVQAGTVSLQVVNPAPGGGASNSVNLEVRRRNPIPRLTSISPTEVQAGGPAFTLVVTGTSFVRESVVRVNGQDRPTDFISETSLAVQVSAADIASGGLLAISVMNPAPGGGTSNAINLAVSNPAPRITSISPDTAAVGSPAVTLIVNGTGFVPTSVVRFRGIDLATTFVTSTQLFAQVPASALLQGGAAQVTVFNIAPAGGTSNAVTFNITNPPPVIASIDPPVVATGGPAFTLTVTGSGFAVGATVLVNGQVRPTTFVSANQLTAQIPASDVAGGGTLNITVVNPAPGGGTSSAVQLTVSNVTPTLIGLSPNTVAAGSAAFTLTVTGTSFAPGATVNLGGSPRPTTFVNSTTLTAQITAADVANAGAVSVTVSNPAPGGGTSNPLTLTISSEPNPTPTLVSLSPAQVPVGSGAFVLTVNGGGFVPGAVVNVNGSARPTVFVNATQVTALLAASDVAAQGTASITVVNPAPGGGASSALTLTITPPNPAPTLTGLSPNTAGVGGPSFLLTVTGTGFVPTSTVTVNGTARTTTYVSATQLTAQINAADIAALATLSIRVTNPAPGGGTSNTLPLVVNAQPNPLPVLNAISPDVAFVGDEPFMMTLTGTGFVAGSVVQLNGTPRATTVVSSTQLMAAITAADLAQAGSFTVTVVNPAPGGGTSAGLTLTVSPLACQVVCFQSPQYLGTLSSNRLPRGSVFIGGVNFNNAVSVQNNFADVQRALGGGSTPIQQLNQQFVAGQLNLLTSANSFGIPQPVLESTIRCYNLNFAPLTLSTGFVINRGLTIGELFNQSRLAIASDRSDDQLKLAAIWALLNGNDPTNRCR